MVSFLCTSCGSALDPSLSPGKPKVRCGDCGALVDLRNLPGFDASRLETPRQESSRETVQPVDNPFEDGMISEKKKKVKSATKRKEKAAPTINGETAPPPFAPALPTMETSQEEDDGKPYAMPGGIDFLCPQCTISLQSGTLVCTRCGFDMRTGKKLRKTVKTVHHHYGPQISPRFRIGVWIFMLGPLALPFFLGSMTLSVSSLLLVLFLWSIMAFILGTWGELEMERKANGKTYFTKILRIGFVNFRSDALSADKYIGIKAELRGEVSLLDYIVLVALFFMFIFPAILFYFAVMNRPEFALLLTGEHGMSLETLYRSRSSPKIFQILEDVLKVSGLQNNN